MKRWVKWTALAAPVLAMGYVWIGVDVRPHVEYVPDAMVEEVDSTLLPPDVYGIPMSGFTLVEGKVKPGATFGDLLAGHGVPMTTVQALVEEAAPHFDVRRLRSGHPYAFIFSADSVKRPAYFVYEADRVEYVVFGLEDSLHVRVGHRPVTTTEHQIACTVTGALYNDLARAGADPALAMHLADVFAWTVDFYRIQKNDVFTVVYSEETVDGHSHGSPRILAARYNSGGRIKEAFRFGEGKATQYYDAEGNSQRKAFLKAPLKFSRISSGFSGRRLHPVQKVM
ncbi:MAG: M23 family peptidase, partial [Flavobacteriales bacterium]